MYYNRYKLFLHGAGGLIDNTLTRIKEKDNNAILKVKINIYY